MKTNKILYQIVNGLIGGITLLYFKDGLWIFGVPLVIVNLTQGDFK